MQQERIEKGVTEKNNLARKDYPIQVKILDQRIGAEFPLPRYALIPERRNV